jgi:hypothetical protein
MGVVEGKWEEMLMIKYMIKQKNILLKEIYSLWGGVRVNMREIQD